MATGSQLRAAKGLEEVTYTTDTTAAELAATQAFAVAVGVDPANWLSAAEKGWSAIFGALVKLFQQTESKRLFRIVGQYFHLNPGGSKPLGWYCEVWQGNKSAGTDNWKLTSTAEPYGTPDDGPA